MFSKPISLIAVYLLTIINFLILLLPILSIAWPLVYLGYGKILLNQNILPHLKFSLMFLVFLISFVMLCYLFFDYIFGFTYRSALKGCKRYDKIKGYEFLKEIFLAIKHKFGENSVKLYIKNSKEINAFAIGGFGRKAIVLTSGLVHHYASHAKNRKEFLQSLESIMGHEMSHLINKDFIPGLLIIINQKATNLISKFLNLILKLFLNFLIFTRLSNRFTIAIMTMSYSITYRVLTFFNRHIVYNLYEFLRHHISRGTEYRCDRQSAQAFGGYNMAVALSFLGKSGYFTLFSTHPSTVRRIKKVQNISEIKGKVRPSLTTIITNYFSWMFLVIICLSFAKAGSIDLVIRKYLINHHQEIYNYLYQASLIIKKFVINHNIFLK